MGEIQTIHAVGGSQLNMDDQFLLQFGATMHQLVINRLLSALDHLQLAAHLLTAPTVLIFSQYSLLRAALAGAATAHWAISGNKTKRRERALKLTYFDLEQQVQFGKDVLRIPVREGKPKPKAAEAHRLMQDAPKRFDGMYREYCSLKTSQRKTKMPDRDNFGKSYETQTIAEMGRVLHKLDKMPNELELLLQYRLVSGFVRNCIWATYTGAHVRNYDGEKSCMVEITGNPVNIYRAAGTALNVVRIAKDRTLELAAHP